MSDCTCGGRFLDAEDFRDHLPCEGSTPKLTARICELELIDALVDAAKRVLAYEGLVEHDNCGPSCGVSELRAAVAAVETRRRT
jgi:hypothetical protein